MSPGIEKLIFGRYTRDECGLPPKKTHPSRMGSILRPFFMLGVLLLVGWLAGTMTARWRKTWVEGLPYMVHRADPAEVSGLLARGRLYAMALPDNLDIRRDLAIAAVIASERAPRKAGYYGNLAILFNELRDVRFTTPLAEFAARLAASGVYAELNDYVKAFDALGMADRALAQMPDDQARNSHRMLLVNAQAYYLATAPALQGGNPEKALHLAQLLVSSRDGLAGGGYASGSAAFLDTLATAWHAAGDADKARLTQAFALGLADSVDLDTYIRHYDQFTGRKPE